jgi:hypothetical protein
LQRVKRCIRRLAMIVGDPGLRSSVIWVTGRVAVVALGLIALGGCAARGRPAVETVCAALDRQIKGCGDSLQLRYSIHEDRADRPPFDEVRYVRTPQVIFIEFRRFDEESHKELRATRYLRDRVTEQAKGSEFVFEEPCTFVHDQPSPITASSVMETAMLCLTDEKVPLYEGVRQGTINEKPELIDGHKCWRIDILGEKLVGESLRPAFRNCEFTVWVDPDIGFCPRRLDRFYRSSKEADDQHLASVKFEAYREVAEGIWFPTQQTVNWSPTGPRTVSVLHEVEVGKPVLPADISTEFQQRPGPGDVDLMEYRDLPTP